jgi:acetylornithine deacetylase
MPFASVKIGPGHSLRSHTANEYIMIQEISEAFTLYGEILNGLIIKQKNIS